MTSKLMLLVMALVAGSSKVAFASDHLELVCTAVADGGHGDKIPLFIHVFENRSSDGESRDETLSTVYQGRLFQGERVNKSGAYSIDAPLVLKDDKGVRFRGTYTLVDRDEVYTLKIRGQVVDDPSARKVTYRKVTADLACVDLSI